MDLEEISITDLIPQRPPFVMVDKVLSCDKSDAITVFTIQEDNIFLNNDVLSTAGVIENMAQSCAARMGCVSRMANAPIKIGYIGDIRNFSLLRQPRCKETLSTHVQILEEVFNLTLAYITITIGEETIASARIKIALTE